MSLDPGKKFGRFLRLSSESGPSREVPVPAKPAWVDPLEGRGGHATCCNLITDSLLDVLWTPLKLEAALEREENEHAETQKRHKKKEKPLLTQPPKDIANHPAVMEYLRAQRESLSLNKAQKYFNSPDCECAGMTEDEKRETKRPKMEDVPICTLTLDLNPEPQTSDMRSPPAATGSQNPSVRVTMIVAPPKDGGEKKRTESESSTMTAAANVEVDAQGEELDYNEDIDFQEPAADPECDAGSSSPVDLAKDLELEDESSDEVEEEREQEGEEEAEGIEAEEDDAEGVEAEEGEEEDAEGVEMEEGEDDPEGVEDDEGQEGVEGEGQEEQSSDDEEGDFETETESSGAEEEGEDEEDEGDNGLHRFEQEE